MSDARRVEILLLAQGELMRSHERRRVRRRAIAGGAVAACAVAIVAAVWITAPQRPGDAPVVATNDVPQTPDTREAPAASGRIEIVTAERPSAGFAEVIDDTAFEAALRSLPRSTGVAVIGGRTHIVANQEWNPAAPIR